MVCGLLDFRALGGSGCDKRVQYSKAHARRNLKMPKKQKSDSLNGNKLVKVVHTKYKKVTKTNKKTGQEYPAIQAAGEPCGVVVALKSPRGPVKIGWSKCNLKLDKFNKTEGLKNALKNLVRVENLPDMEIPHSIQAQVVRMALRAQRYYANRKA